MNRKPNCIASSRRKKIINKYFFRLFFYLAAASGAVDEAIFEDAFNSSHAIPVK
jgi:hypothetical protein